MTVTHKNPGFDAQMPAVDFDKPEAMPGAPTGTLPVKTPDGTLACIDPTWSPKNSDEPFSRRS